MLLGAVLAALCLSASAAQGGATAGPGAVFREAVTRTASAAQVPGARWGDKGWGDREADFAALDATLRNVPALDAGSLASVTAGIGARAVWAQRDAGGRALTGNGVTVAVLDTGVEPVPGLDGTGKVVAGPDLSFEANSPDLVGGDNYGHGTHMASIIAAKDAVAVDARTGQPRPSSAADQLGIAPDAKVLAVKLATRDGSTDVSQVIAGIDWVVQHRNDNGMAVRVINLSYGTQSMQPYSVDPLAAAAENAWRHGIVVVVSGGNDGPAAKGLNDPAYDPYVIAVGASDADDEVNGWRTPVVADFSSRGTADRHVDVLAPGASLVGLRVPGSFVDDNTPEGLVQGDVTGRLLRGSGTSQAAAVVSGAVALMLQANPALTPDQVKAALMATARPVPGAEVDTGAGQIDVAAAVLLARYAASRLSPVQITALSAQTFPRSTGAGSLEAARGGYNLMDPETGELLTGELDVQGQAWDGPAWYAASLAQTSWDGGWWNGSRWAGDGWTSGGWAGARWTGARWTGARWTDVSWDGARWTGARWTGARWTGARWTTGDGT